MQSLERQSVHAIGKIDESIFTESRLTTRDAGIVTRSPTKTFVRGPIIVEVLNPGLLSKDLA
jgi:hypothetical protein